LVTLAHEDEMVPSESTELNEEDYSTMKAHYNNFGNPNFSRILGKILRQKIYDKQLSDIE
jgi:hypothetical protein